MPHIPAPFNTDIAKRSYWDNYRKKASLAFEANEKMVDQLLAAFDTATSNTTDPQEIQETTHSFWATLFLALPLGNLIPSEHNERLCQNRLLVHAKPLISFSRENIVQFFDELKSLVTKDQAQTLFARMKDQHSFKFKLKEDGSLEVSGKNKTPLFSHDLSKCLFNLAYLTDARLFAPNRETNTEDLSFRLNTKIYTSVFPTVLPDPFLVLEKDKAAQFIDFYKITEFHSDEASNEGEEILKEFLAVSA